MTTPDRKTLIGKVLREAKYVINEDDLREYLPVCAEDHPAFFSDAGARAAGYERRVIPPSFAPHIAVLVLLRAFDWADFFFDYKTGTAMFGEQELEYLRPLYAGETLTIQSSVADVYEKQGKRTFDVVTVQFSATDQRGAAVFRGSQAYLLFK